MSKDPIRIGEIIHGFAGGLFGRDSLWCRRVEAIGTDWIVTRNHAGVAEFADGLTMDTLAPVRGDAEMGHVCDIQPGLLEAQ